MSKHHTAGPGEPRLRIIFADTSFSLGLPVCLTFGEIADSVEDIARLHRSSPLSIDIRLAAPATSRHHSIRWRSAAAKPSAYGAEKGRRQD